MKSGRKILKRLVKLPEALRPEEVRHLGNGDLRSLLIHAKTHQPDAPAEMITALAMVEATTRFVYGRKSKMGKGNLL